MPSGEWDTTETRARGPQGTGTRPRACPAAGAAGTTRGRNHTWQEPRGAGTTRGKLPPRREPGPWPAQKGLFQMLLLSASRAPLSAECSGTQSGAVQGSEGNSREPASLPRSPRAGVSPSSGSGSCRAHAGQPSGVAVASGLSTCPLPPRPSETGAAGSPLAVSAGEPPLLPGTVCR